MDFSATIDLIIKDLDEAVKIIDDLKRYPGVPALQIELAKSKCKSAGEVIALLKDMNLNSSIPDDKTLQADRKKSTIEIEVKDIEIIIVDTPTVKEEKMIDESPDEVIRDSAISKPVSKEASDIITESSIIADRFSHMSARLNEQMGTVSDDDVTAKMMSKHVESLSQAIGVNDRFLFIREIFNGDSETYTRIITKLENAENINDARAIIMSYTGQNTENEATRLLMDLIKRKLPLHE